MTVSPSYPDPAAATARGTAPRASGARTGLLGRVTIRARLILLSSALLIILVATNLYLTRKLSTNAAGMIETAELLRTIEQANNAQIAFGEVRYWMADLAVSLLTLPETNAKAAHARMERYLDQLAARKPDRIAAVRRELAEYDDLADKAVDEYTADRRVIGNSLLAQSRQHGVAVDKLLGSIVTELTQEAVAARDRVVTEAGVATRLSQIVTVATVLAGALLTVIPWQTLLSEVAPARLALVGLISVFMPVPIALDVMFAAQLQQQGVASGYVMLFAMTLGTYSIIPSTYLWREVSKRLAVILFVFFLAVGWITGLLF